MDNNEEPQKLKKVNSSITLKNKDESELKETMVNVIHEIMHEWKDAKIDEIEFKKFTGGISNFLYCAKWTTTQQRVLVRIYGDNTEQIIDRDKENAFMSCLGYLPFIAKIYGCFKNGVLYEFLPGDCLKPEQMIENYKGIASRVAELHQQHVFQIEKMVIWEHIRKIIDLLEDEDFEEIKYSKDYFYKLMEIMKDKIGSHYEDTIVLCHNDLLSGNILKNGDEINLIDYEYGSYNYRGYDIGNHFAECMGFNIKKEHYPTKKQQHEFLTVYFSTFYNRDPTHEELKSLYKEVNLFSLCSHFFWGAWGLLQNRLNKDIDFNYKDYSISKMELIERNMQGFFDNDGDSEYCYV